MKQFFCNEKGQLSMGRLLSLALFILCSVVLVVKALGSQDLGSNVTNIIIWGFGIAIGGKALQSGTEALKKK